ncbi:MAG TPA: hypothetical protein VK619_07325 [Pyrinomonadaceae bacterium]|nr:hypothetical protein [Pyrinomonadaceae bacterium]
MKAIEARRLDMFIRVQAFRTERAAQFPQTSFAGQQFAIVDSVVNNLEDHARAQASGKSTVKQSTSSRAAARDELLRDMAAISRTARAMALTSPGLDDKFRVPYGQGNQALLASARAFAADALPLKAEFIRRGMPADFLDDLQADIAELDETITNKAQGAESHVAATAGIDTEIDRGMNAVRELDSVMRNTFANDPSTLAAWLGSSHVERPPRRKESNTNSPHGTTTENTKPSGGGLSTG